MANGDVSVGPEPTSVRGDQMRTMVAATTPFFSGLWLVILYIVFVSLVVLSLGAHQLQYSIRSFRIDGDKYLPLWAVSQIYANWVGEQDRIIETQFQISETKWKLEGIENQLEAKSDDSSATEKLNKRRKNIEDKLEKLNKSFESQQGSQRAILKYNKILLDESVGDFILALRFYRSHVPLWTFGILPDFTDLPPGVLTVILVLAMGALGGTIHLTYYYFGQIDNHEFGAVQSVGYYIFRPFLGSIIALSIYILAKAGVLVLSNPVNSDFGDELSPFFVSFIGIISGLLAEQAVETIQRTGKQWFSSGPAVGRERWAHRVRDNLDGVSETDLAEAIGVNNTLLQAWLNQTRPVPESKQTLIAAWLRKPARDLFTDIEPAETPADAVEPTAGV